MGLWIDYLTSWIVSSRTPSILLHFPQIFFLLSKDDNQRADISEGGLGAGRCSWLQNCFGQTLSVLFEPLSQGGKSRTAECSWHNPTLHFNPLTQPTGLISIILPPPPRECYCITPFKISDSFAVKRPGPSVCSIWRIDRIQKALGSWLKMIFNDDGNSGSTTAMETTPPPPEKRN